MKKMLVSDYDKTFYLNDEDIKKNIQAVDNFRKNGNLFVFATGRSYFDFKRKALEYGLKYDYVILDHGAFLMDCYDNILNISYIDNAIIKKLRNDLNIEDAINMFCCSGIKCREKLNCPDLTKIHITYYDNEIALKVNDKINKIYKDYVTSFIVNNGTIEIISNKISKDKSITILLDKINFQGDVYTIGDGYSDIKMCEKYNGYCMKDSVAELKKVSNNEYDSVSDLISDIYKQNLKC